MGPGAEVGVTAWPPTVEGVNAWLWGPEGRSRLRHAIDRYRLPAALADDLAQEVLYRAWRAIGRGEAIVSLPAFATALLSRAAVDLLRGRARRGEDLERPGADAEPGHPGRPGHPGQPGYGRDRGYPDHPGEPADPGAPADPSGSRQTTTGADPVGDAAALALDPSVADGMRRSIHGLLGPRPAAGAAALAYMTLVADEVPPPTDCPVPEGGADPEESLAWAALWCTGRDDCFEAGPGGAGPPAAAIRARRSRALRAMRALLAQAANGLPEDDRA